MLEGLEMTDKMRRKVIFVTVLLAFWSLLSCSREESLTPTRFRDDLLFEFPQGNTEIDRRIQTIQENFNCYVIYKDIEQNHLNRAWINLYPGMVFVANPVPQNHLNTYLSFLEDNIFRYFNPQLHSTLFPRYFFLVDGLHREDNGVAKAHIPCRTDGVDFWSLSFQSDQDGYILQYDEKKMRITFAYKAITLAFNNGLIKIPSTFSEGIDYKNPVYGDPSNEWHYQTRGFVKYVQPDFEYESPATDITVIAMAGEDFLMYVRKILFSTPETFAAENGQYDLVMRRYNIVLDVFSEFGIDLNAIATGE